VDPFNRLTPAEAAEDFRRRFEELAANIETFIRGKPVAVRLALICLFAEGHLLIEDVPGVAKTSLARAIARSITATTTRRIQFTPDLLPSDITGVRVWDLEQRRFEFEQGPVFANIVLGDEINRASPKTQSALLEAMAERQVTVHGEAVPLERPFLCIATQNPIDQQGTYPLPEAQLDRFTMRIGIGYPSVREEIAILRSGLRRQSPKDLKPVMTVADLLRMTATATRVTVSQEVAHYIALLVQATRKHPAVRLGVSPRGSVALGACCQARAASLGRHYATVDDVKELALPVLAHRMLMSPDASMDGTTAGHVLEHILAELPATPPALGWG
jgi:MoxR-like ATPase